MYAGGNTLMNEGRKHSKTPLNMRGQPLECPPRFISFHPVIDFTSVKKKKEKRNFDNDELNRGNKKSR